MSVYLLVRLPSYAASRRLHEWKLFNSSLSRLAHLHTHSLLRCCCPLSLSAGSSHTSLCSVCMSGNYLTRRSRDLRIRRFASFALVEVINLCALAHDASHVKLSGGCLPYGRPRFPPLRVRALHSFARFTHSERFARLQSLTGHKSCTYDVEKVHSISRMHFLYSSKLHAALSLI